MNLADLIFLAAALSVDAGAVSFSQGLLFDKNKTKNSLLLAFSTGFFQFIMPVAGYFFAGVIYRFVEPFSKTLAFLIFMVLGLKFIHDGLTEKEKTAKSPVCITLGCLFMLSVATSIDALAAGVNFYFLKAGILFSSLLIGFVTFFVSLFCFYAGRFFKKFPSKYLEVLAGVALIVLSFKTYF